MLAALPSDALGLHEALLRRFIFAERFFCFTRHEDPPNFNAFVFPAAMRSGVCRGHLEVTSEAPPSMRGTSMQTALHFLSGGTQTFRTILSRPLRSPIERGRTGERAP